MTIGELYALLDELRAKKQARNNAKTQAEEYCYAAKHAIKIQDNEANMRIAAVWERRASAAQARIDEIEAMEIC